MKRFIKHFMAASWFGAALCTVMGCEHCRSCVDSCWTKPDNSRAQDRIREMRNAQTDHGRKLEQTVWNTYFVKDERTHESTATLNEAGKEFLRQLARTQSLPDPQIWLQYPSDVTDTSKHDQIIAERRIAIRNFLSKETHLGGGYKYQIAILDPAERTDAAAWAATAKKGIDIQGKRAGDQREDAGRASGGGVRPKATFQQIEGASGGSGGASQSKFTIERREDASRGSGGGIQGKLTVEQREDASAGSGGGIQDKLTVKRDDTSAGSGGGIQGKLSIGQSEDASAGSGGSSDGARGVVVRNSIRTIAADSLGACDRRTIVR